jgi:hypothetical protein
MVNFVSLGQRVDFQVILTDGQSASLSWYQVTICETRSIFLLIQEIIYRYMGLILYRAPSLTRGRISTLLIQVLLDFANDAMLGSKFRRNSDHILLSHLKLNSFIVVSYGSKGSGIHIRLDTDQ